MILLDTPGFNETPIGDTEATAGIFAWTLLNYRGRPPDTIYLNRTVNALTGSSIPKNPWNGGFRRGPIAGVLLLKDSTAPGRWT